MEDIYTVKIKNKPDRNNVYPSERRYSASTVTGIAWIHLVLAATLFLLAILSTVTPGSELENSTLNSTEYDERAASNQVLIIAPSLLAIFALGAGFTAFVASIRWYVDSNINWLFFVSILSTLCSISVFVSVAYWFGLDYTDNQTFVVLTADQIANNNETHFLVMTNSTTFTENTNRGFSKTVLSINILIATFFELLLSILSVKISFKGMRSSYDCEKPGKVTIVTKIKGNQKPDLIEHYPKPYYNQENQNSDYQKERMMEFLNGCTEISEVPSVVEKDTETVPVSWGDTPEKMYNQNNITFDTVFKYNSRNATESAPSENVE